ncbi:MAG: hypothetical protein COA79_02965 [Planctomycetota bacterium]|nr:MAG: hypothetical protein COA79_02965 [Planctomycetota bacterium]
MALILDIGNTNLKIYQFQKNKIISSDIIAWKNFEPDNLLPLIKNNRKAFILSVVPDKKELIKNVLLEHQVDVNIIGEDLKPDLKIKVEEPSSVGIDRLLGAYGAFQIDQQGAIVIDVGTAITIDIITHKKEFLGGIIAPGLRTCAQALETSAPLLKGYNLFGEIALPGKSTGQAIRTGLVYLVAGGIEKVINQLKNKYGDLKVIATGGDFVNIQDYLSFEYEYNTDLLPQAIIKLSHS